MKRHTFFFPPVVFSLGRAMSECLNPRSCCTVHGEPIWVPDRAARLFVRSTGHRCPDHAPTFRSRRIPLDSKIQNSRKKNLWMGSVMATHTIVKLFGEKKTWYIMIFNLCLSSSSCFSPASWGTSSDKHGLMIVLMFCVPRLWCSILRSGSKRDLFGVPTGPNSSALEVPVVPRDIHIIVRQAQKRTLGTLSCWSARVGDAGIPNFSWNLDKSHRR